MTGNVSRVHPRYLFSLAGCPVHRTLACDFALHILIRVNCRRCHELSQKESFVIGPRRNQLPSLAFCLTNLALFRIVPGNCFCIPHAVHGPTRWPTPHPRAGYVRRSAMEKIVRPFAQGPAPKFVLDAQEPLIVTF